MSKCYVVKTLAGLTAAYDADKEHLSKLKLGEVYRCEIKRPRNIAFHCKYWALLNLVFDNLPEALEDKIRSVDELHTELKMQTGVRMKRVSLSGQTYYVPGSIAFHKMSESEFDAFYQAAANVIVKYILPVDADELLNEVESFL